MSNSPALSLASSIASLPEAIRQQALQKAVADLGAGAAETLIYDWKFWARPEQLCPPDPWNLWVINAGRGWGKTRAGAEWIRSRVDAKIARRIALVGRTVGDVRGIMIEGESGLLEVFPPTQRPHYEPSKRRITFHTGAVATTFSSDEPDGPRGWQHDTAWCDEPASWRYPIDTWDNLMMGIRSGTDSKVLASMTPKATALVRRLLAEAAYVTRGNTYENLVNLAPAFAEFVLARYEGTRLGRQELHAELLEDVEGALWTSDLIEANRLHNKSDAPEAYRRIVVAIDPSWGTKGDEVGIIAAALGFDGHGYVLEDWSGRMTPAAWGNAAAELYDSLHADRIVAETAFGAEDVRLVVRVVNQERTQAGKSLISFGEVHASRGKLQRAEPVHALYEQGRIHHVGYLAGLEQQMTSWVSPRPGERGEVSPDRVDALVWAITELMITHSTAPSTIESPAGVILPKMSMGRR